ncbi:hypothetical protein [Kineococcus arenarius]|uniref:hypothetical protein n=1 Tax=Kineococcus sp. SYSU DK007 TaxID=3383128 RepID=UPI003D7D847A
MQGWGVVAVVTSALLSGAVLAASWWLNRRAWRSRVEADRRWLRAHGVDAGEAPRTPAAWRLVLTPDLGPDGSFLLDVAVQGAATPGAVRAAPPRRRAVDRPRAPRRDQP